MTTSRVGLMRSDVIQDPASGAVRRVIPLRIIAVQARLFWGEVRFRSGAEGRNLCIQIRVRPGKKRSEAVKCCGPKQSNTSVRVPRQSALRTETRVPKAGDFEQRV